MSIDICEQVKYLLTLPQYEQRSEEWFAQRKTRLTSSDLATVSGENPYEKPISLLYKKCGGDVPFFSNAATRHGQKYESVAIEKFEKEFNKKNYDFGMLPHPTIDFLGGSPDGVTADGILLEVKCPFKRKIIPGQIPEYYVPQVQMNMEICDVEKAAFIEYRPPSEWNIEEWNVLFIDRDREWFKKKFPVYKAFWDQVLKYRKEGIDTHPDYDRMVRPYKKKKTIDVLIPKEKKCMIMDD